MNKMEDSIPTIIQYGHQLTYAEILDQMETSFLNQMLRLSIFLFVFSLYVYWYAKDFVVPSILKYNHEADKDKLPMMIIKNLSLIAVIASIYFPVIIVGYITGWYI